MDRAAIVKELFDLHQEMRDQVQILKLEATTTGAHDAATALGVLIDRAENLCELYLSTASS
jgi:hypothetical protein